MTTSTVPEARTYRVGGPARTGLWRGMRTAERRSLLLGALPALLLAMVGGTSGLLLGGCLFLLVAAFTYVPSRRLGGITTLRWSLDEARFRQLARHPLGTRAWEAGVTSDGPVPVNPPPTVGPVAWFRGTVHGQELGILYAGGLYVTLLEVASDGGDPDPVERDGQAASWSGFLDRLSVETSLVSIVGQIERQTAAAPDAHLRWLDEHADPTCPPELTASYREIVAQVALQSEDHRNWLLIGVPDGDGLQRALVRATPSGQAPDTAALLTVLARETTSVIGQLRSGGLSLVRVVSEAGYAGLIRHLHEPDRPVEDPRVRSGRDAWSRHVESHRRALLVGGTSEHPESSWAHVTAAVTFTGDAEHSTFLDAALIAAPGITRTFTVVSRLSPWRQAYAASRRAVSDDRAEVRKRTEEGIGHDLGDVRQLTHSEQVMADTHSRACGVTSTAWLTVSAPTLAELEEAQRTALAAAGGLSVEWCDKEHAAAFINSLPLGRGPRR